MAGASVNVRIRKCIVSNCPSTAPKVHRLPINPDVRRLWVLFLDHTGTRAPVTASSRVCSAHISSKQTLPVFRVFPKSRPLQPQHIARGSEKVQTMHFRSKKELILLNTSKIYDIMTQTAYSGDIW